MLYMHVIPFYHPWKPPKLSQLTRTILFDLQPKVKRVKKVAPAPYTASKPAPKKVVNPLIEKRPRNYGIGKFLIKNTVEPSVSGHPRDQKNCPFKSCPLMGG